MKLRRALRLILERNVKCEVIGQEACPLMLRWEFLDLGFLKAMIHYFPAEVSDRDPHDHPRPFVTLVLRGNYRDESWEPGDKTHTASGIELPPPRGERVSTGGFRYRPAEHLHIVETDVLGCWTLVIMGPITREWGFVRLATGSWWPWGKYVQKFGGVTRCDAPPDTMSIRADVIERNAKGDITKMHLHSVAPEALGHQEAEAEGALPSDDGNLPTIGDFVWVENDGLGPQCWAAKIENITDGTAWVRGVWDFKVQSVKTADIWPVPVSEISRIRDIYYRRGREAQGG